MMLPVFLLWASSPATFSPPKPPPSALRSSSRLIHRELGFADFACATQETALLLGSLFPSVAVALSLNLLLVPGCLAGTFSALLALAPILLPT